MFPVSLPRFSLCRSRAISCAAAISAASACGTPIQPTPIARLNAQPTVFTQGDSAVVIDARAASPAWAIPTSGGLYVQTYSDSPTDSLPVVARDTAAQGLRLRVYGRVRVADFRNAGRTSPTIMADSIKPYDATAAPGFGMAGGSIPLAAALLLAVFATGVWMTWRLWLAGWWRRRGINFDALRAAVEDTEAGARKRHARRAVTRLKKRRSFLTTMIADGKEQLGNLKDAPGDLASDREDERLYELLAVLLLPLDILVQIFITVKSESASTWQSAAGQGLFWTLLLGLSGFVLSRLMIYRQHETRRAVKRSAAVARWLWGVFFASIVVFTFARAVATGQHGILGDYGFLVSIGLLDVAVIAGLYSACAMLLGKKRKLRELEPVMAAEVAEIDQHLPWFDAHAREDEGPDTAGSPTTPKATSPTPVVTALIVAVMLALPHPSHAQQGPVCPAFDDVSASVDSTARTRSDSLFAARIGELAAVVGCAHTVHYEFTSDTAFWFRKPEWFKLESTARTIASRDACPHPDLSRLGPAATIGREVNDAWDRALTDCQARMDRAWQDRVLRNTEGFQGLLTRFHQRRLAPSSNRTALAEVIRAATAPSKNYPLAIIRTDGCNTKGDFPDIMLGERTTLLIVLMESDPAWGGADASAVCVEDLTRHVHGGRLRIVPWVELGDPTLWDRVLRVNPIGSGN